MPKPKARMASPLAVVVDESVVLKLYEALSDLDSGARRFDESTGASFDLLLDATRRALISPKGPTGRALLSAVARFDDLNRPAHNPDEGK